MPYKKDKLLLMNLLKQLNLLPGVAGISVNKVLLIIFSVQLLLELPFIFSNKKGATEENKAKTYLVQIRT